MTARHWKGVVMIQRPGNQELMKYETNGIVPVCFIMSARIVQLDGMRAISEVVPYPTLRHLFRAGDGDHIFCEAEYTDGMLHLYERTAGKPNLKEWVDHSYTDEQL